jgi:hypothetical protein
MEKYGFIVVPREEAKTLGLPEGSGMFIELYHKMMDEIKRSPMKAVDYKEAPNMTKYEKDISFLNRYFVFKKIRTINAEKLTNAILGALPSEYEFEETQTKIAKKAVEQQEQKEEKRKPKALQRKLVLTEAVEAVDEDTTATTATTSAAAATVKKQSSLVTEPKKTTTRKKKAVEFVIEE